MIVVLCWPSQGKVGTDLASEDIVFIPTSMFQGLNSRRRIESLRCLSSGLAPYWDSKGAFPSLANT